MSSDENYKRLRAELDGRLKSDERLKALAEKISAGTADLTDTAKYSQIVSHILGDVISKNIGEIKVPLGKELVCKELLKDHYDMINGVIGKVQANVDEKLGIHLNTVKAPFPTERVEKAAHSLEDPTVPEETIKRRARSATENIANSMHDDTIKENAKWRSKAGLDTYLVRDAGGGCCKWCQALEGRYKYVEAPDDIFRRHDNCTCTVIYECGRQRQDIWSKKTWQASEKELQQRRVAAEAAKPTRLTKEQAQTINEQSKPRILSKAEADAINERAIELKLPRDPDIVKNNSIDNSGESGIIKTGGQSGAYNDKNDPDFIKREESANNYYEEIRNRNRNNEIEAISKNSGLTIEESEAVFSHVFEKEHLFEDGSVRRFDPDYYMQQSFMRLREGKNILPHDLTLLRHELTESALMEANPNMVYEEAHAIAEKQYNYQKELIDYLKKKEKGE